MKIKFLSEESLNTVKENLETIFREVVKKSQTLQEIIKDKSCVKEVAFEVNEFTLDMSQDKPELTDLENIKRVYSNMKMLSESQASDERIWAAYSLSEFKDYMKYRWNPQTEIQMANRYLFNDSPHRSIVRNGIARLWWIGKSTYDSSRADHFELTAFICKKQDIIGNILERSYSSNPNIVKAILSAFLEADKAGISLEREEIRDIAKYINLLGGTYILDCLSGEEIYDKVAKQISYLKKQNKG